MQTERESQVSTSRISQNTNPLFSVIIPTYHRNDLLDQCLARLEPGVQTLSQEHYEVIVTDDGSETTAEQMICEKYPWVRWVLGPRKGPAANRNHGAKYAQGEWLVFTDDDCLPDSNWLTAFVGELHKGSLALEGAIHPLGNLNQDLAECPVNLTGGHFWSANIAIKKQSFNQIDGFDVNYLLAANEDVDLKLRLQSITKIRFVRDAYVYHPVRQTELKKYINAASKRAAAWAFHAIKNKQALGYNNNFDIIVHSYQFHTYTLIRNIIRGFWGNALKSLIAITYEIPLIWIYVSKA